MDKRTKVFFPSESQQITIDPKESSREIVEKTQKQGNSLSSSTDKPTGRVAEICFLQ